MSLCHILAILPIFQTFPFLQYLRWWSVISDLWCDCCKNIKIHWIFRWESSLALKYSLSYVHFLRYNASACLDYSTVCMLSHFSHVWLFVTIWTVAHQSALSMGILQARPLQWVVMAPSRGSSQPRYWTEVSCIAGKFFTIWATREAQEYWSGWSFPSPGELLDSGIKSGSHILYPDSLTAELPRNPKSFLYHGYYK